jgi:Cu(I)/Ag(I) efflux system periplasmic protein CusF
MTQVFKGLMGAALIALSALSGPSAVAQPSEMAEAEVRKIDKESKKVTLKHGAIKNLDMPAMTMVFNVNDPKLLEKLQAGDKVRFSATNEGGKFTVTEIQPVK